MEKILVIGGSGFMGSHVADELSASGYNVVIYDLFRSPWLNSSQSMVLGDFMDKKTLRKAMDGVSCIYHFAGISDIGVAKSEPNKTLNDNIMGVANVLDIAVEMNVKRFVYASTMYVYSDYGSFYRASKQAAEIIVETYAKEYGIEYTFLRYGSLYGPRAQEWNGIKKFITQIIVEQKLDYSGDGSEIREYIHVKDAAKLSVDILASDNANTAITITGQQVIRVNELISVIFEILGLEPKVNYHGTGAKADHYGKTPYRYSPKTAKKIVPVQFVDLGQGLLEIIEDLSNESNK